MKKQVLIIPLLLLSLYGFSQQNKLLLLSSYQTNSQIKADKLFTKWATETKASIQKNSSEKNDTLINLKNVFKCVYDSILSSTKNTSKDTLYFVLQNEIEYEFTDTTNKDYFTENTFLYTAEGQIDYLSSNKTHRLNDFVPAMKTNSKRYVLLNQEYDSLFSNFLGNKKYFSYYKGQEIGKTSLPLIIKSQNETKKRLAFLNRYLLLPDNEDFTTKWNLSSYPNIPRIIFTNGFNKAWADINFGGMGGLAFLEKISGTWVLVEIRRTWIE